MSLLTRLTQQIVILILLTTILLYAYANARVEKPAVNIHNLPYMEREIPANLPSFISYTGLGDRKHRPTGGLIVDTSPTFSIPSNDIDATLFSRSSRTLGDAGTSPSPTVDPSDPPGGVNVVVTPTGTENANMPEIASLPVGSIATATTPPTMGIVVPTTILPSTNSNSKSSVLPGDDMTGNEKPLMENVIGIALGVSFGVLAVVAIAIWWSIWWRRKQAGTENDLPPRYSEVYMRNYIGRNMRRREEDRSGEPMEHTPNETSGGNNIGIEVNAGWL